jgi:hypothetical protein
LYNIKVIANAGEFTSRLNKKYGCTGIGGPGGKGDRLFDETFEICKLYGLFGAAVVFYPQVYTGRGFGFAPAGYGISGAAA